ncbi:MAG: hypothetical protein AB7I30_14730 [Isosphaeraceae bacterium]
MRTILAFTVAASLALIGADEPPAAPVEGSTPATQEAASPGLPAMPAVVPQVPAIPGLPPPGQPDPLAAGAVASPVPSRGTPVTTWTIPLSGVTSDGKPVDVSVPYAPIAVRVKPFWPEIDRWYALKPGTTLKTRVAIPGVGPSIQYELMRDLPLIYYLNEMTQVDGKTYFWAVGFSSGWVTPDQVENPELTAPRLAGLQDSSLKKLYLAALLELGSRHDAERVIEVESRDLNRVGPNFDSLFRRAAAYRKLRDYQRVLGDLTEALRFQPDSVDALLFRAEVNARLKRPVQTRADLIDALRLDPQNPEAATGIEVLSIQTFGRTTAY